MNIKTKLNLGQLGYPITYHTKPIYTKCTACNGTNKIEIEGETFDCPKRCSSGNIFNSVPLGHHQTWGPQQWHTYESGIIGKITIENYLDDDIVDRDYRNKKIIRYMLSNTGIGSGTCWDEENVFASLDEANKECEVRNAKVAK